VRQPRGHAVCNREPGWARRSVADPAAGSTARRRRRRTTGSATRWRTCP